MTEPVETNKRGLLAGALALVSSTVDIDPAQATRCGRALRLSDVGSPSVPAPPPHRRLAVLSIVVVAILSGCASGSPQTGAATFLDEHAVAARHAAASARALALALARLTYSPGRSGTVLLARVAAEAHRDLLRASEWSVAGQGEEGAEEEDVPRAETQVAEGAGELAEAFSALEAPAAATSVSAPSASALARYRSELASGRAQWNEGIAQLWYLAHASHPPTI